MDKKTEKQPLSASSSQQEGQAAKARPSALRWGRGVYRSKDVPIRLLDGLIAVLLVLIVLLTATFAIHGGYNVTFDSMGGSAVETQRLRYGKLVEKPDAPTRLGYDFTGWYTSESTALLWDFSKGKVENDMTLYAGWSAAAITVKFDLDGGTINGESAIAPAQIVFGEAYGALPTPEKEDFVFSGWQYSGQIITPESVVQVNGEHVLTALWEPAT